MSSNQIHGEVLKNLHGSFFKSVLKNLHGSVLKLISVWCPPQSFPQWYPTLISSMLVFPHINFTVMSSSHQPHRGVLLTSTSLWCPPHINFAVVSSSHQHHCGVLLTSTSLWCPPHINFTVMSSSHQLRCGVLLTSTSLWRHSKIDLSEHRANMGIKRHRANF